MGVVVDILFLRIVGAAQRILQRNILVIGRVFRSAHGRRQENQPIQWHIGIVVAVFPGIGTKRTEGFVGFHQLHAVEKRIADRIIINVKGQILTWVRRVYDLLYGGLPTISIL